MRKPSATDRRIELEPIVARTIYDVHTFRVHLLTFCGDNSIPIAVVSSSTEESSLDTWRQSQPHSQPQSTESKMAHHHWLSSLFRLLSSRWASGKQHLSLVIRDHYPSPGRLQYESLSARTPQHITAHHSMDSRHGTCSSPFTTNPTNPRPTPTPHFPWLPPPMLTPIRLEGGKMTRNSARLKAT
ncbi:hypothetical protein SODALDRAFT_357935 [Sodiomyces alkalinus F11]|uniref:Uncharacterized protein n=1 Tax=Sodiomyces alkalinus (strain CBS 110278 / VKM F-3762 / F11) TaxID=1314773 RepID=A0A3N2PYB1_SODAK|nr:hypothetical protein SODALDRAFT_357935 [Sodiomyces alkalinus F11]ROT39529.1 hypothetical protein SODALDRAFT_357935 [Sodiomyces alkalinus F11]